MTKRIYTIIIAALVVLGIVDVLFVHAHYPLWYHEVHGFEIGFGLIGAFVLMFFSLGLGEFFLWKTTCSVLLEPEAAGFGNETAKLTKWFAEDGDEVLAGRPIAEFQTLRGTSFTVDAPYDGTVAKCFIELSGVARVGETVVDLTVSKQSMGHGQEASHA